MLALRLHSRPLDGSQVVIDRPIRDMSSLRASRGIRETKVDAEQHTGLHHVGGRVREAAISSCLAHCLRNNRGDVERDAIRAEEQERQLNVRWDLADKILAGEMTLEELPRDMDPYTSFAIEDYVTQVGQGPIAGRDKEMLGSTDVKPVLLRRLWIREITAMLEGRPMTDWKIPTEPISALENA